MAVIRWIFAVILLTCCLPHPSWGQSERQKRRFQLLRPGPISRSIARSKMLSPQSALAISQIASPQVSPNGKWLVFELQKRSLEYNRTESHLYLISTDGGVIKKLTEHGTRNHSPRWSPSSKSIAFVRAGKGAEQIHVLNTGLPEARAITKLSGGATDPIWSSDEKLILFKRRFGGRKNKAPAADPRPQKANQICESSMKYRPSHEIFHLI